MKSTPLADTSLTPLFAGLPEPRVDELKAALLAAFAGIQRLAAVLKEVRHVLWRVTGPTFDAYGNGQQEITAYVSGPDVELGFELRPDNFYDLGRPVSGWVAEGFICIDGDGPAESQITTWSKEVDAAEPETAIQRLTELIAEVADLVTQQGADREIWRQSVSG